MACTIRKTPLLVTPMMTVRLPSLATFCLSDSVLTLFAMKLGSMLMCIMGWMESLTMNPNAFDASVVVSLGLNLVCCSPDRKEVLSPMKRDFPITFREYITDME